MIKITKRLFFYAAFLLCAALVFAADNSKKTDKPAIRVYDSKDKLVCELTESKDIESFNYLLMESAAVAFLRAHSFPVKCFPKIDGHLHHRHKRP